MSEKDVSLFYEDLAESIMELYSVDRNVADNAIRTSNMDSIIKKNGMFVFHDAIEVWAKSVWTCYRRLSQSS